MVDIKIAKSILERTLQLLPKVQEEALESGDLDAMRRVGESVDRISSAIEQQFKKTQKGLLRGPTPEEAVPGRLRQEAPIDETPVEIPRGRMFEPGPPSPEALRSAQEPVVPEKLRAPRERLLDYVKSQTKVVEPEEESAILRGSPGEAQEAAINAIRRPIGSRIGQVSRALFEETGPLAAPTFAKPGVALTEKEDRVKRLIAEIGGPAAQERPKAALPTALRPGEPKPMIVPELPVTPELKAPDLMRAVETFRGQPPATVFTRVLDASREVDVPEEESRFLSRIKKELGDEPDLLSTENVLLALFFGAPTVLKNFFSEKRERRLGIARIGAEEASAERREAREAVADRRRDLLAEIREAEAAMRFATLAERRKLRQVEENIREIRDQIDTLEKTMAAGADPKKVLADIDILRKQIGEQLRAQKQVLEGGEKK